MTSELQALRELIRNGEKERFDNAMKHYDGYEVPPLDAMDHRILEYEKPTRVENWPPEPWTCPQCGAENRGADCGFCRRAEAFRERAGADGDGLDAAHIGG